MKIVEHAVCWAGWKVMLPFQYQGFCLVESLTVVQNPDLMAPVSRAEELNGNEANDQ